MIVVKMVFIIKVNIEKHSFEFINKDMNIGNVRRELVCQDFFVLRLDDNFCCFVDKYPFRQSQNALVFNKWDMRGIILIFRPDVQQHSSSYAQNVTEEDMAFVKSQIRFL